MGAEGDSLPGEGKSGAGTALRVKLYQVRGGEPAESPTMAAPTCHSYVTCLDVQSRCHFRGMMANAGLHTTSRSLAGSADLGPRALCDLSTLIAPVGSSRMSRKRPWTTSPRSAASTVSGTPLSRRLRQLRSSMSYMWSWGAMVVSRCCSLDRSSSNTRCSSAVKEASPEVTLSVRVDISALTSWKS